MWFHLSALPLLIASPAPVEDEPALRLELPAPQVRAEHFLVGRPAEDGTVDEVAVMRLVTSRGAHATVHEQDLVFRSEGLRIHQVERHEGDARRLVWRELGPRGLRTWIADWTEGEALAQTVGYGWRRRTHGALEAEAPLVGALTQLAAARRGEAATASVVDPLRDTARPRDVTPFVAPIPGGPLAAIELAPGTWAVRTDRRTYESLRRDWAWRPRREHPLLEALRNRRQELIEMGERLTAATR